METLRLKASSDNLDIAVLVSEPEGTPKGILQIVHGMCEYKERYIPFMEFMSAHGYVCVIHDHRGHGQSVKDASDLGYMYKGGWKALIDDTEIVNRWARKRFPGLEYTLFGHSMGSMVVRSFTKRHDDLIDRLFVCGCPSDNPAKGAGKFLADLTGFFRGGHHRSKFLQKLAFGSFNKPFEAEGWISAWVCSDPETLEAYHNDPLCQFIFTANGFSNLFALMKDCYSRKGWKLSHPDIPVHFISGADDPCAISEKAIRKAADFLKETGYSRTDLHLFAGMRHEILNETGRQEVWDYVLERMA